MPRKSSRLVEIPLYSVTALMSLALAAIVMRLDKADLRVPFVPLGDATYYQSVIIRPLMTQAWYLMNPSIGAPQGLRLYDFPSGTDSLLFAMMKAIVLVTRDTAVALNVFYLLTYPLVAMTMLYAARSLHLRRTTAAAVALLFTFLPYHLIRGEGHVALSAYFMLPIALLVALRPYPTPLGAHADDAPTPDFTGSWRTQFARRPFALKATISVVLGLTGVYYGFFYMVMLAVAAVRRAVRERRWLPLLAPLVLAGITAGTIVAINAPTIIYQARNGKNPQATIRDLKDSELYSLRPIQLLLPAKYHRVPRLASLTADYQKFLAGFNPAFDNESRMAALGLIGAIGFLILLMWLIFASSESRAGPNQWRHFGDLASINIVMLLLGVVGGGGFVIAMFISPMLRGYNRVSVVIGMVALLAVGMLLDSAYERLTRLPRWLPLVVAAVLVCFGVADQTTLEAIPRYRENKIENVSTRAFAVAAEKALPAGTAVFQLPYAPFPGSDPKTPLPVGFDEYRHLVPNEYSFTLRWSYPAMRGRPQANWQKTVASLPVSQMVSALGAEGFGAVYVDRRGYEDLGASIASSLTAELGPPAVTSSDDRTLIWKLPGTK